MEPFDTYMGMPAILIVLIAGIGTWILCGIIFAKDADSTANAFAAAAVPAAIVTFTLIYLFAKS